MRSRRAVAMREISRSLSAAEQPGPSGTLPVPRGRRKVSPTPCRGPLSRREFLRAGALALGGLSLADLLAARATAASPGPDAAVILFWMWGGPSQLDTYDLKPQAPAEYRGPFRPIHTNVPGLDICELFPLQAKLGNKMAVIRSLHHTMSAHADGGITVLTGKPPSKPDP